MAVVGEPLERMLTTQERRLRWFTVYHAVLAVIAVAAIGWIALPSGVQDLVWIFIYAAIVMPAGVPVIWWLNRRGFRRTRAALESLQPWVSDAKLSAGVGYLLVLDSGIVLSLDVRSNLIRFLAFFSAGRALLHPNAAQAQRWASRIRGLQTEGAITNKKGPAEAQAELERFRLAMGARWYMMFFREVRAERLAAGDPMYHEILAFFVTKWADRAAAIAENLGSIRSFLETAPDRCFRTEGPEPTAPSRGSALR